MLIVTSSLIIGISCAILALVNQQVIWIIGLVLVAITVVALLATSWSDPGIVPRYTQQNEAPFESWSWSQKAQCWKPRNAQYDEETQTLVTDFDHFCPWTGTAIGGGNMKQFTCFTSMLCILLLYVVAILVIGVF